MQPERHLEKQLYAALRISLAHIFIPGDMPFISSLLLEPGVVVGPFAPRPWTSSETVTLPAFSNSSVTGTLSPYFRGSLRSIIIKW